MKYLENEFIPAIPDGIKYSSIDKKLLPFPPNFEGFGILIFFENNLKRFNNKYYK